MVAKRSRRILMLCACLTAAVVAGFGTRAQQVPGNAIIIAMAQQYVLAHYPLAPSRHFNIAFDLAQVHPQPGGKYWAVVGGFRAGGRASRYKSQIFVAAVRLICPQPNKPACWRLEKLAIGRTIVFDRSDRS